MKIIFFNHGVFIKVILYEKCKNIENLIYNENLLLLLL